MKKSLRFISLLIAVVFLISGAVMVVCHAEPEAGDQSQQGGSQQQGGDQSGQQQGGDQGQQGGDQGQQGGDQGQQGGDQSGQQQGGDQSGQQSGNDGYENQNNYDSGNDTNNYNEYANNNAGTVENQEPVYYGDASQSGRMNVETNEQAAGSVSSNLYNTSGMSAEDAKPNEWSDITLDEKTVKTGVTDFSSIKENTQEEDNGQWILYLGYALLGLSVLGILYFIISTIAHRNAVKKAERLEQRRRPSSRSAASRMDERDYRDFEDEAPRRRTSRYADENEGYSRRRGSSRADTDEVYVPRRAAKR
ncbi:MAG TPA: hypothetical protein DCY72_06730 [Ruminococcaceae bacterium]|nr:hypothetical protein [Oscillospiraceae bacterium]